MNRKRIGLVIVAAVVVAGLVVAGVIMYEPAIAPVTPPAPDSFSTSLKREGARVVALGDCAVCHTTRHGKPFAGGLPLATPFGTIYATNITPDPQTGIGTWSEAAFARALRHGIARNGSQLYPAFPYPHFTRMSDHDIAAAYAYLMSREPVHAKTPANKLVFPLNFRPLLAFWNVLFLRPGPRAPDASQSAQWNRGKVLVDGPGHCALCHSPLNAIGGEKSGHAFDGGVIDGWEAPALNALSSAPKPWTHEQLVAYLRTGLASGHGAAAGPMQPVTRDLATVPTQDVEAIAAYILSLQKAPPPVSTASVAPGQSRETTPAMQRGAVLFNASCAQCHGNRSPMQTIGERPSLALGTAVNADTPRNAIQMILNGIDWHGENRMNYMPAFGGIYDDRQIADILAYVRGTWTTKPAWPDAAPLTAKLRKEDSAR